MREIVFAACIARMDEAKRSVERMFSVHTKSGKALSARPTCYWEGRMCAETRKTSDRQGCRTEVIGKLNGLGPRCPESIVR